ncbi:MAG: ATPase domain-containing protein [Thermoplasmata archaeon]
MNEIKRIRSGIEGFDELIEGGFVQPSIIYLLGEPGTGKTTFAMQFLMAGALLGEKGVYFSAVGEPESSALRAMSNFKFFNPKKFKNGTLSFIDLSESLSERTHVESEESVLSKVIMNMVDAVTKESPKRIVIDSITPFSLKTIDEFTYRKILYEIFMMVKAWNAVSIIIGEVRETDIGPEQYLSDGIIRLGYFLRGTDTLKTIKITKLRGTAHDTKVHLLQITRDGVSISDFPLIGADLG